MKITQQHKIGAADPETGESQENEISTQMASVPIVRHVDTGESDITTFLAM